MIDNLTDSDTMQEAGAPRSSKFVLSEIERAKRAFQEWNDECDRIDDIYSNRGMFADSIVGWATDNDMDLFWSSFEILKPAIYARPPQPVVAPMFKDGGKKVHNTAAELLERSAIWTFANTAMGDAMTATRDDLIFTSRGVLWTRLEKEDGLKRLCVEHLDRKDFLHDPARCWGDVAWVAARFHLTKADMEKRFGDKADGAVYRYTDDNDIPSERDAGGIKKCSIWEVWHKADKRVYWVTEGVDQMLDEDEPDFKIKGFFPTPRPAFATLQRRSLIPSPDYSRYRSHFEQINELTRRIYSLLNSVRMKGIIPAGGDVADAIGQAIADDSNDTLLIPVPAAALDGVGNFVVWLPLDQLAAAITGLIEARRQLIEDYYQLSGISDIMRGATEAEETLGAQQLKSQYGSVRVREKSAELQRLAADCVKIACEIIAEHFPQKQLLEMAQMDVPTRAEVNKRIKAIEEQNQAQLEAIAQRTQQAVAKAQAEGGDPESVMGAAKQEVEELLAQSGPQLEAASSTVTIDDVMSLLRDDKLRSFIFEIESSSTILTDEAQEKASRNEFLGVFSTAIASLQGLASMGEAGADLAGAMLSFTVAPYRAGRELDGAIQAFIQQAPEMAQKAAEQAGEGAELAEANNKLAEAEMAKAQAAMQKVQADSQLKQVELQGRMQQMQMDAAEKEGKFMLENGKLELAMRKQQQDFALQMEKMRAEIDKTRAQTAEILSKIGLDVRKQELSEYQAAEASQARAIDQERAIVNDERNAAMGERQQSFTEEQGRVSDDRADRPQQFSEQQTQAENGA